MLHELFHDHQISYTCPYYTNRFENYDFKEAFT